MEINEGEENKFVWACYNFMWERGRIIKVKLTINQKRILKECHFYELNRIQFSERRTKNDSIWIEKTEHRSTSIELSSMYSPISTETADQIPNTIPGSMEAAISHRPSP
mmetsp:Transcript_3199/g.3634  ORF Transcript_3199/g.3634 Transcript_3199/m.3634 type:complete len:109 (+) Transcript_3199:758-1084(+)